MIRMVNRLTGGDMWVHEDRVEEYLAAGHTLAAPPKPEKPVIRNAAPATEANASAETPKTKRGRK